MFIYLFIIISDFHRPIDFVLANRVSNLQGPSPAVCVPGWTVLMQT